MKTGIRLFLALWPDPPLRAALAARRDQWQWPAGARPVATDALHLTLHFIGPLPRQRLPEVQPALARPMAPVTLQLDRYDLWAGGVAVLEASTVPDALLSLYADLGATLSALGLPVTQRPLRPHVTLARHAQGVALPPPSPLAWRMSGYALVASIPQQGMPNNYQVLQRYGED